LKESDLALSFFGKKKEETTPATSGNGAGGADKGGGKGTGTGDGKDGKGAGGWEWDSRKAEAFFERAGTLHEAANFGFAMYHWIRGLRFNPLAMNGLEGFFKSSGQFFTENPKGEKEDTFKLAMNDAGSGKTDVDKYLVSLVQWSSHPFEAAYAVRSMQNAAKLGLEGPTIWIAERAYGAVSRDKRPRKEHMVAVMEAYKKFEKFEDAVRAGEAAIRIDPGDGQLASDVKNLSAEWTTRKGGFDQTGEGGFRKNIRDAAKQQQMEERDRVVTTGEVLDRQIASAKMDHETSPNDRPNAIRYIEALVKRSTPEDEAEATRVAEIWHAKTQEYRFRETIDTIRVRQLRRRVTSLKLQSDQPGASDELKDSYKAAVREYLRAQIESKQGEVAAYPTDLVRKFELGKLMFQIGKFEEAIGLLQEAKADPANKAKVDYYLGLSFQKIGWNDEAIETLRGAMANVQAGDSDTEMTLKYGLMEALLARGESSSGASALTDGEEAMKLASSIAIQNISYKDVRAKRDLIKALIAKLKAGSGGA
jgi:tetratricopeptide (TPR) repeat protein